ncbi:MAG: peptidoglycan-binding protein [Candidatus Omnitrophica bacterium]|nr:peptidoglycan-binding protein [Candidatus Omnitrophota bacterium]
MGTDNSNYGKKRMKVVKSVFFVVFVFTSLACERLTFLKREAKEERSLLGHVESFNSRVKEIEIILKAQQFDPGVADGVIDRQTRIAIKKFQETNGLKRTGFIDFKTSARLDALKPEGLKKKQPMPGPGGKKAQSSERIRKIQQALQKAGFDPGPINGIMNERTNNAVKGFQNSNNLTADGVIGKKTWGALKSYL